MAEIYVPTVAEYTNDLALRYSLHRPTLEKGHKPGLMLFLRPDGLTGDNVAKQVENLEPYAKLEPEKRPVVFGMHPNMPVVGRPRFNLLTEPEWSQEYLGKGIDFMAQIPDELTPAQGKALSFHLNTLITAPLSRRDCNMWDRAFEGVLRRVKNMAEYGKSKGVQLAVETTPIPEFGDMPRDAAHSLGLPERYWSDLANPWPLLLWRDEAKKLRAQGVNIAVDFCHSYIATEAVKEVANLPADQKTALMNKFMLSEADIYDARKADCFDCLIMRNTQPGDIWHINDAVGLYKDPQIHGESANYQEGVTLFKGEIPAQSLRKLLDRGMQMPVKLVVEVNETDFKNNPNTKKSLEKVLWF